MLYSRSSYQLNNINIYDELKKDKIYDEFVEAIEDRINHKKFISSSYTNVFKNTCNKYNKFNKLFKKYVPEIFDDNKCKPNSNYKENEYKINITSKNDLEESFPLYNTCHFNFYNYNKCSKFKIIEKELNSNITTNSEKQDLICNISKKKV